MAHSILPLSALQGLKDERQARQLAAALFAELPRTCREELVREDITPEYYACLDRLMRACIAQGPARASVILVLSQMLLQWQSHRVGQGGWVGLCPPKPWRAHACLLLVNSWLQLVAGEWEICAFWCIHKHCRHLMCLFYKDPSAAAATSWRQAASWEQILCYMCHHYQAQVMIASAGPFSQRAGVQAGTPSWLFTRGNRVIPQSRLQLG